MLTISGTEMYGISFNSTELLINLLGKHSDIVQLSQHIFLCIIISKYAFKFM